MKGKKKMWVLSLHQLVITEIDQHVLEYGFQIVPKKPSLSHVNEYYGLSTKINK